MSMAEFNIGREEQAAKIAAEVRARIDADKKPEDTKASDGGLFGAVLDAVNPLQHIPGVSTIYRATTNDAMSPMASMAGGFLFGGPVGLGVGAASSFIEMLTGKSPAEHALALVNSLGDENKNDGQVLVANKSDGKSLDETLMGKVDLRAQNNANVFNLADANHQPGFGATKDTVEYSSNIWSQTAIMGVIDKYDNTNQLNDKNPKQNTSQVI